MRKLSQKKLEAWVREWQAVLRLNDWLIRIIIERAREIGDGSWEGYCRYQSNLKRAAIIIRDPLDDPEDADFPPDVEATIIHELLHLHFADFYAKDETPEQVAQERAIESIAQGLIGLKRGKSPPARRGDPKRKPTVPKGGAISINN